MKVVVGMSGGVDSSVAALLLKQRGFEVVGLSLLLFETRGRRDAKSCCSLETVEDARRTADIIGVEHRMVDARDKFMDMVIKPFVRDYARGLTPNPCILCNRHIKFPFLLDEMRRSGADFIATGHYVRVEREGGNVLLKTGIDQKKDQSYVLYALRAEELERLILPLGTFRKDEVRLMAMGNNLPVFNRPESQEICFVEGKDYIPFVSVLEPGAARPGPIMDECGKVVGAHKGLFAYTIGQRKGLGVASPTPLYVYRIDAGSNTLYVGPKDRAFVKVFGVSELNWLKETAPVFAAGVKVRSMMSAAPARIRMQADEVRVEFDRPQWAPAPGQSAVFYDGDTVLGGGIIKDIG